MKAVLLLVSPKTDSPQARTYAIEQARALSAELLVVAVLDPEIGGRVGRKLEESGFVGEKVSESLVCCLERDLRTQGEELVQGIATEAQRAGVVVHTRVEEGDLREIASRCCSGFELQLAVVAAEKRSWLGRLLGSEGEQQRGLRLPRCEVKVIEG